jgi:pimeloyl-ACP methyl ester carboxylesterase
MQHEIFFVGGTYAGPAKAQVMHGQMSVEMLTPGRVTQPYPLVLIHGAGQTSVGWVSTPYGRPGWAGWFAERGWKVCIIDQPARGRSAWQPGVDGPLTPFTVPMIEERFTGAKDANAWPQARLHTQWPGSGHPGDPVFDQFYASQVPYLANPESEKLMQAAGAALLDRIGPAVLMTHSQSGLFGWLIADARPGMIKGIVALEPAGPPYQNAVLSSGFERASGLTASPLTYDPPVTPDSPLEFERQTEPDAPDLTPCWEQKGKPRRLVNLAGVPVLMVTAEASYHAVYDHCTARYLDRAGVANTFIRLEDRGIHGNGHMLMLEKNSHEIAALVDDWLTANIGGRR